MPAYSLNVKKKQNSNPANSKNSSYQLGKANTSVLSVTRQLTDTPYFHSLTPQIMSDERWTAPHILSTDNRIGAHHREPKWLVCKQIGTAEKEEENI